jgi:hypothetical protein
MPSMPSRFLEAWLNRSGSLHLHINLSLDTSDEDTIQRAIGHIDIIVNHITRWISLEWKTHSRAVSGQIYAHLSQAVALRELQFHARGVWIPLNTVINERAELTLHSMSRLELSLHGVNPFPLFGGASVTELSLIDCGLTMECLVLLSRMMPNLRQLQLEDSVLFFWLPHHPEPANAMFCNIKSLIFHYLALELQEASLFLSLLTATAKSLEYLSLRVGCFEDTDTTPTAIRLISEAFDNLPSTLKDVEISLPPLLSLNDSDSDQLVVNKIDSHALEDKLRTRLRDLTRLEHSNLEFGTVTGGSVAGLRYEC